MHDGCVCKQHIFVYKIAHTPAQATPTTLTDCRRRHHHHHHLLRIYLGFVYVTCGISEKLLCALAVC